MNGTSHRYMWVEGDWSTCRVQIEEDRCGAGIQNRTVLCIRTTGMSKQGVLLQIMFLQLIKLNGHV